MPKLRHYSEVDSWYFITTTLRSPLKLFSNPANSDILLNVIANRLADQSFNLDEFVIMPDHFHAIIIPRTKQLADIIKEIKRGSARLINIREGIRSRSIWLTEYYDEQIRSEKDLYNKRNYIWYNPVKVSLSDTPEQYLFSSANEGIRRRFNLS